MKKFKHTLVLAGALFSASFAPALSASAAETVSNASGTYKVLAGDTLTAIAAKFGVSLSALLAANPSIPSPNLIYAGQIIHLPNQRQSALSNQTKSAGTYKVAAGDTLSGIAGKFGVSLQSLLAANPGLKAPNLIYVGQAIQIPGQTEAAAASTQASSQQGNPSSTHTNTSAYRVVTGDSMWSIATRMNVSLSTLLAANPQLKAPYRIYTGQAIQIPNQSAANNQATQAPLQIQADITPTAYHAASTGLDDTQLIATAEQYLGAPYAWGGSSASGFDCSGFTQYVFAKFGVNVPRTSYEQYAAATSVSTPAPGDLVFFSTNAPGASHVGIYIGGGKFISATPTYGIHIDSLSNPYWGPHYLGAGRV